MNLSFINSNYLAAFLLKIQTMGYWTNIDGVLSSVSVGNSMNIWGFNPGGTIYRRSFNTDRAWIPCQALPEEATINSLSVGDDGHILACDSQSYIYRWDPINQNWHQFADGRVSKINVGNNYNIWGINDAGTGWIYTMDCVFLNTGNTEPLIDVSVGSDGSAVVLGNTKTIYRYIPPSRRTSTEVYRAIGGISQVDDIATADESFMLALTSAPGTARLQRYVGENYWVEFPFKDIHGNDISERITKISLGGDGTIIALTDNMSGTSNIYQYIPYDIPTI
ncbi:MAG: tectonin domain-containing protein [Flavobacteriales bacterium]